MANPNDYADLVGQAADEQAAQANKYVDSINEMTNLQQQQVQSSVYLAQPANPDKQAQVMKLAQKTNLAPDLVERNFDTINQEFETSQNDYGEMIRRNPKFSSWIENVDNAKLVKDDMSAMKNLEDKVGDTSFTGDLMGAFSYGSLNLISGLVKSAALGAGKAELPIGVEDYDRFDLDSFENQTQTKIDSGLYDNTFTRYLDEKAKTYQPKDIDADIIDEALKGNLSRATRAMTLQIVSNIPQLGLIAATRGAGLAVLGASSAGAKYAQNIEKGIEPQKAKSNALVNAGIETGIEMVGGIGGNGFKNNIKTIVKNLGPETAVDVMKQSVKHIFKTSAEEGAEEFVTSVAQDIVDYATNVNHDGLQGIWQRAGNAFLVGAGSGGVTTVATMSPQLAMRGFENRIQAFNDVDIYNSVGQAALETKLNERMPEKQKEFLKQTVEGTPIQEMFMDLDGFETYFQKKGISPAQGATELGLQEQYNQAKQAGSDIKVNYADWVGNAVNTEHYNGLQNDIKFSPQGLTKNQTTVQETQAREELTAADAETRGAETTTEGESKLTPVSKFSIDYADNSSFEAIQQDLVTQQRAKQLIYNMQTQAKKLTGPELAKAQNGISRIQSVLPDLVDAPTNSELRQRRNKSVTEIKNQINDDLMNAGLTSREARVQSMILGEAVGALADASGLTPQQVREQFPLRIQQGTVPATEGVLNQESINSIERIKEQGYTIDHTLERNSDGSIKKFEVTVKNSNGMLVGSTDFSQVGNDIESQGVDVSAFHRRKGIATAIYRYAQEVSGQKIVPSESQTSMGKSFWEGTGGVFNQQGDEIQGQIQFRPNNESFESIISLFKSKNQSTFAHESAHYLFNVMGNLAARAESSDRLKADYKGLLDYVGVESTDQLTEAHQEQVARAWEQYLMEGKAPTKALKRAFATFKTWLTSIYKSIQGLETASGVTLNLTPEVRSIFDRMLMSQEQIDLAEQRMNYNPLFSLAGLSDDKAAKYVNALADARIAADNELRTQLMETERRKQTQYYKNEKEQMTKKVTEEINQDQVYVAHSVITKGIMPDGSPLEDGTIQMKIDRKSVVDAYGDDAAKLFPRGMFSPEGAHVDVVSEMYGFESTADFVEQFTNFIPKQQNIEATVNAEMEALYPDMLADPIISEQAVRDAHNADRDKVYRMEMDYLMEMNPGIARDAIRNLTRNISDPVMKAQASEIIGTQKVGEIRPSMYERAEAKHNKAAGELLAKGDVLGAFEAKRKAALNNYLYKAATEARDNVTDSVKEYKKMFRKDSDLAKSRDVDLVNAAKAVLAEFGITRTDKTADEYLAPIAKYDPDTYQNLKVLVDAATEGAANYKDITYAQFDDMNNAVKALWDLSKDSRELTVGDLKLKFDDAKNQLSLRMGELQPKAQKLKYEGSMTPYEQFSGWIAGFRASARVVEHWAIAMGGDFKKIIFDPVQEAATAYRTEKREVLRKYAEAFRILDSRSLSGGEIKAPELGTDVTFKNKGEILGAILHTGNASNLQKLLVGRGYGSLDADGNLDTGRWDAFKARMIKDGVLTKADFDWAQAIWDLNESLKPGAWKSHKKMYGFYPNEITANAFGVTFADGSSDTYRGGYVPAIADPTRTEAAATREERAQMEMNAQNSFMFPTTGRGFTKGRVDSYNVPLSIDINQVAGHIDKVLRFTHIEPAVKFVNRIVSDDGFREELATIDQAAGKSMLIPWLQRSASQRMSTPMGTDQGWQGVDKVASIIRVRTGMQIMGGNVINALQNYTGLSVAMVLVKPRHMRNALWDYTRNSTVITETISAKSEFMKNILSDETRDLQKEISDIIETPSTSKKIGDWVNKNAYVLQKISQDQVSAITWQGAYDQSIENGMTEKQAIKEADSIVRQTQASMTPEGSSRIMAGPPVLQLFVQFFGYFNNLANLNETQFTKIVRESGLRKGAGQLFMLYMLGSWMPAVLSDVIRRAASGVGLDEDDDDEYMDDFISMFLGAPTSFLTAQVPFAGQLSNLVVNRFNDKRYDDRLNLSPTISTIESMAQLPGDVYDAINKKNKENKGIRSVMTALGVATGLPGGFAARPLTYLNDVRNGDAKPSGPVDFTRGLVTGKRGND